MTQEKIASFLKDYLDTYYKIVIENSTLNLNQRELENETDSQIKQLITEEIQRHKEENIDKTILNAVNQYNLPQIPKLIGEMKQYLADKFNMETKFKELIKQELLSYDIDKLNKMKRYVSNETSKLTDVSDNLKIEIHEIKTELHKLKLTHTGNKVEELQFIQSEGVNIIKGSIFVNKLFTNIYNIYEQIDITISKNIEVIIAKLSSELQGNNIIKTFFYIWV